MISRMFHFSFATMLKVSSAMLFAVALGACATTQMPYHGFADQATLDKNDATIVQESAMNGPLDPMNLAQDGMNYTHDGNAYDRLEEGYYQWGAKMYDRGYRDVYYVEDLAPKAFGHEMEDTYEHAIDAGFRAAAAKNTPQK
jgi:hypothetical protein